MQFIANAALQGQFEAVDSVFIGFCLPEGST